MLRRDKLAFHPASQEFRQQRPFVNWQNPAKYSPQSSSLKTPTFFNSKHAATALEGNRAGFFISNSVFYFAHAAMPVPDLRKRSGQLIAAGVEEIPQHPEQIEIHEAGLLTEQK